MGKLRRLCRRQIAIVEFAPDFGSGEVVGTITSSNFDIPTTIAAFGNALYVVNARFATPPTPSTTYSIVRLVRFQHRG